MMRDGTREMQFFDRLGPRARQAARNAPRDVDVQRLVRDYDNHHTRAEDYTAAGDWIRPDLQSDKHDAELTCIIEAHSAPYVGKTIPVNLQAENMHHGQTHKVGTPLSAAQRAFAAFGRWRHPRNQARS